jgi:hypothetical protein
MLLIIVIRRIAIEGKSMIRHGRLGRGGAVAAGVLGLLGAAMLTAGRLRRTRAS